MRVFERRAPAHLTVIDAPNGTYLRFDGSHATLAGRRTWTDKPLDDASAPLPEVDDGFVADTRERLERDRVQDGSGGRGRTRTVAGR